MNYGERLYDKQTNVSHLINNKIIKSVKLRF